MNHIGVVQLVTAEQVRSSCREGPDATLTPPHAIPDRTPSVSDVLAHMSSLESKSSAPSETTCDSVPRLTNEQAHLCTLESKKAVFSDAIILSHSVNHLNDNESHQSSKSNTISDCAHSDNAPPEKYLVASLELQLFELNNVVTAERAEAKKQQSLVNEKAKVLRQKLDFYYGEQTEFEERISALSTQNHSLSHSLDLAKELLVVKLSLSDPESKKHELKPSLVVIGGSLDYNTPSVAFDSDRAYSNESHELQLRKFEMLIKLKDIEMESKNVEYQAMKIKCNALKMDVINLRLKLKESVPIRQFESEAHSQELKHGSSLHKDVKMANLVSSCATLTEELAHTKDLLNFQTANNLLKELSYDSFVQECKSKAEEIELISSNIKEFISTSTTIQICSIGSNEALVSKTISASITNDSYVSKDDSVTKNATAEALDRQLMLDDLVEKNATAEALERQLIEMKDIVWEQRSQAATKQKLFKEKTEQSSYELELCYGEQTEFEARISTLTAHNQSLSQRLNAAEKFLAGNSLDGIFEPIMGERQSLDGYIESIDDETPSAANDDPQYSNEVYEVKFGKRLKVKDTGIESKNIAFQDRDIKCDTLSNDVSNVTLKLQDDLSDRIVHTDLEFVNVSYLENVDPMKGQNIQFNDMMAQTSDLNIFSKLLGISLAKSELNKDAMISLRRECDNLAGENEILSMKFGETISNSQAELQKHTSDMEKYKAMILYYKSKVEELGLDCSSLEVELSRNFDEKKAGKIERDLLSAANESLQQSSCKLSNIVDALNLEIAESERSRTEESEANTIYIHKFISCYQLKIHELESQCSKYINELSTISELMESNNAKNELNSQFLEDNCDSLRLELLKVDSELKESSKSLEMLTEMHKQELKMFDKDLIQHTSKIKDLESHAIILKMDLSNILMLQTQYQLKNQELTNANYLLEEKTNEIIRHYRSLDEQHKELIAEYESMARESECLKHNNIDLAMTNDDINATQLQPFEIFRRAICDSEGKQSGITSQFMHWTFN